MPPVETLRLAIIQTTTDYTAAWDADSGLNMTALEEEQAIKEIKQHVSALMHEEYRKPEIVLLPELSVPLGFLPTLKKMAIDLNAVIIAGMDFQRISSGSKKVANRAVVVIPNSWGLPKPSKTAAVRYVGKTYPAKKEKEFLVELGMEFKRIPEVWVFDAGDFGRFAVTICYDFLDLERVAMYRQKIQHLFVLSYNKDITSFDHAAEALARMVYCNVVVCNSGFYGGSAAVSPYHDPARRLIYRHAGNHLATSQIIDLPVRELLLAQQGKLEEGIFKGLPPGADAAEALEWFETPL